MVKLHCLKIITRLSTVQGTDEEFIDRIRKRNVYAKVSGLYHFKFTEINKLMSKKANTKHIQIESTVMITMWQVNVIIETWSKNNVFIYILTFICFF